jgi:hypothetical protein
MHAHNVMLTCMMHNVTQTKPAAKTEEGAVVGDKRPRDDERGSFFLSDPAVAESTMLLLANGYRQVPQGEEATSGSPRSLMDLVDFAGNESSPPNAAYVACHGGKASAPLTQAPLAPGAFGLINVGGATKTTADASMFGKLTVPRSKSPAAESTRKSARVEKVKQEAKVATVKANAYTLRNDFEGVFSKFDVEFSFDQGVKNRISCNRVSVEFSLTSESGLDDDSIVFAPGSVIQFKVRTITDPHRHPHPHPHSPQLG